MRNCHFGVSPVNYSDSDDFLVPDVSVKRFLRLFNLRGICRVSFVCILVMLVSFLVSGVFSLDSSPLGRVGWDGVGWVG